ncbi:MAG: DHHC palmitoyltransferase-domain-containing protein [Benjaminiella poitrasii]|nr:MAG: DHHC palmitoyltransferase-domain-containing protein [Benjaminiella poitrasii]
MSKLEKLSDRFLRVGRHPFKICMKQPKKTDLITAEEDQEACCCCHTDSPIYSKCWPIIFLFSALTDFPMPLPKGKKPGQHRDWGWIPFIIVTGLVVFVYYSYLDRIFLVLLRKLHRKALAIAYFVPLNIFIFLFIISYCRIASQKPGNPVSNRSEYRESSFSSTETTVEKVDMKLAQKKPDTILGNPKWCNSCQIWKPDRAHHCRVCDACVLRMDHHCPWVNGCVGFANYRYYIQFLCYVSVLAIWTFCTSLAAFIQFHGLSTFDRLALAMLIISAIITVMIGTFTLSHIWLVLLNRTTIENSQFQSWNKDKQQGKSGNRLIEVFTENGKNVFNQGCWNNWIEIMGSNKLLWFLPLSSKKEAQGDGIHFGYDENTLREYKNEDQSRRTKSN